MRASASPQLRDAGPGSWSALAISLAVASLWPATRIVGARLNALGQAGEPRDVAGAVAFLCGRGSRGVNGQVLRVCGGFMGGR